MERRVSTVEDLSTADDKGSEEGAQKGGWISRESERRKA